MQCSVWYSNTVPDQNYIPEQGLGVFNDPADERLFTSAY